MSVKLESSDGQVFEVPREVAEMSATIKNMLADIDASGSSEDGAASEAIPLASVTGKILDKILVWARYHHENPEPQVDEAAERERTKKMSAKEKEEAEQKKKREISPWDKEYADVDQPTIFQLMVAANYLDIKPLLELTCKTVANMINGKTPDEIRALFNIKNDLTPEDEEQLRADYGWSLDNLKKTDQ